MRDVAKRMLARCVASAALPLSRPTQCKTVACQLCFARPFHSTGIPRSSEPSSTPRSEKVDRLAAEIASLTLLEAAELTDTLKERFGIKDVMMAAPMAATAPAAAATGPPATEEEAKPEKTMFTVILDSFDAASKIKLIKEVRAITGLGLKEAKEAVEGAPKQLKADVKKEEAESIREKLEAVGGKVKID